MVWRVLLVRSEGVCTLSGYNGLSIQLGVFGLNFLCLRLEGFCVMHIPTLEFVKDNAGIPNWFWIFGIKQLMKKTQKKETTWVWSIHHSMRIILMQLFTSTFLRYDKLVTKYKFPSLEHEKESFNSSAGRALLFKFNCVSLVLLPLSLQDALLCS